MKIEITLTDSQVADLNKLRSHMRDEASMKDAVIKCMEQGITQLAYRYKRNVTKWQEAKENKQLLAMLLAEREARDAEKK